MNHRKRVITRQSAGRVSFGSACNGRLLKRLVSNENRSTIELTALTLLSTEIAELGLLDVESHQTTQIRLYDSNGDLIKVISSTGRADNLQQAIDVSAQGVSRMEVQLQGSGAITNVTFSREAHLV